MPQPTFPPELDDAIVDMLAGDHEALRHISETAKKFVPRAQPILFRNIEILSFKQMFQLGQLLHSELCTIPTTAESLRIQFEFPVRGRKQDYSSDDILFALADVYEHFRMFDVSISINFPWVVGRQVDWTYLQPYTSIRKFSVTGTYNWISEITQIVYFFPNLESLIVDASFKHDIDPPQSVTVTTRIPAPNRDELPCRVASTLRELALSPESLPMMRWFYGLQSLRPSSLHVLRLRADCISLHRPYFYDVIPFLKEYGKGLVHLYAWFDSCSVAYDDLFEVLGDALQHTPNLDHLDVTFAGACDESEAEENMRLIVPFYMRRPPIVKAHADENVGLDEAEFWEAPSTMCEVGEDREVCERLIKLSSY
ncbi:hypothetical protein FA13DRAFT_1800045 [Coprinellus micaceus]|uniref:F-box domain-containing protein n=1 Tax=Coprinellus micaceus TaxID=71717 RepID=A0A4Y7SHG5_COPMI|nr:hypothetical protein FA13DRAFT_1800045 [Coprinellus micaceus]